LYGPRDVLHPLGALPGGQHLPDKTARDGKSQQSHCGNDNDQCEMGPG
jgi:hypothetical protein